MLAIPAILTAMMTEQELNTLITRIRSTLGCSKELAGDYAAAITDPPEIQNGQVVIRSAEGRILTRLPESVLAAA